MQDVKKSPNQDNNIQNQKKNFSDEKIQSSTEGTKIDVPLKEDDDVDEDENHYNDSISRD